MRIVVSAANGRTGRHTIDALKRRPERTDIVAFAREPNPALQDVVAAQGDLLDKAALDSAMRGADVVIHYAPPLTSTETAMGLAVIDAAVRNSVKRFVYLSVIHPQIENLLNHQAKLAVESYLINSGLDWTILRPQHYMQNVDVRQVLETGALIMPYPVDAVLGHVDMADLAEAAAKVAVERGHTYATYDIASDEHLSSADICEQISAAVGKPVAAREVTVAQFIEMLTPFRSFNNHEVEMFWRLFGYYARRGIFGNSNVLRWLLGRPPTSFKAYVEREMAA